ncbi:RimK family alpha-L-glutamate ligase [Psychrobacter sp. GP33]|uniref:ATP-grasp domain-containing protein n=1 Tax=Psychrobacter sp. GP33 TaxID=2758709 RepID=UPI0015FCA9E4|nr:hypothetical protein [Psychrobacter sp. GP33]
MKIAIHHRINSFSDHWIDYCEKNNIDYKVVNAFDSDIITQLKDCDAFIWHHHHGHFKDVLVAKKVLFALEHAGIKVFPNFNTAWHFDDKVAQKYLLEAIDASLVPSYVFYDKKDAIRWAKKTTYPKVFKLKGGAGATNVKLIKTQKEALKLIDKAFNKGFAQFDRLNHLKERYNKYKIGQDTLLGVAKGAGRLAIPTNFAKQQPPEKGYIYFQDFIPNDGFDIRVVVINGKKAAAEKRFIRENDFRASGSGKFSYENIDTEVIKESFKIANQLDLQSVAFDFVIDKNNKPLIIELSYGFGTQGISNVSGYWDNKLKWYKCKFNPQEWIIEDIIIEITN